jgi:5-methylcytosine-specific restriction endonuclease McrA
LAHLTYSRLQRKGPARNWDLTNLRPLLERFSKFAEHVVATRLNSLPPYRQARWQNLAARLKAVK